MIDRQTMKCTGKYLYQILPKLDARDLIETNIERLVQGLYSLSVENILDYVESISQTLIRNRNLLNKVHEIYRCTSEYPDAFLDSWFTSLSSHLDRNISKSMIDNELSLWGKSGSAFLNGWVEVPANIFPGATSQLSRNIFHDARLTCHKSEKAMIRAMPTRQLHITAGNTPDVPLMSAVRAILTKSAAVIKLPFGGTLTGALFALAAAIAEPLHPLTKNLSLVYWQGGDSAVEKVLFQSNSFDRIVVWGSPETVASVQSKSLFTRTVCLNPRYGASLIGREAFNNLEEVVLKASLDTLIYNQKACSSSLIHYIEGTGEQISQYARLLLQALNRWDNSIQQFIPPSIKGSVKRLKRGKYGAADWYLNYRDGEFTSGVVVTPDEFDILDHPMCRLVVVRPVDDLKTALEYLHPGVSTVGVYPEERRLVLRDLILARGVSNVFPLGQGERLYPGMPHDGMTILNQLVDWKNS